MNLSRMFLLPILAVVFSSCKEEEDPLALIMKANYEMFYSVSIEARKMDNDKYVAYKFTKEIGEEEFTLPNYNYYSKSQIENDTLFDVFKYGIANGWNGFEEADNAARQYSDSLMGEFEKMNIYKSFSSKKQGDFIVFYLDSTEFIAYVPDSSRIYNEFWRARIFSAKQLEKNWVLGRY